MKAVVEIHSRHVACLRAQAEDPADGIDEIRAVERIEVELPHSFPAQRFHLLCSGSDSDKLRRLDELVKELGLES